MTNVDDLVAERIAEAQRRREWRRRQRAQLAEAREHGLEARHLTKMRRWQQDDDHDGGDAA